MEVTILGNQGPFPGAGGACSGYLVEEGDIRLLLDCGNGVLANLQKRAGFEKLDAILLTHLHSDHISDMMVLKYAIQIKMKRGRMKELIRAYAPAEPAEEYARLNVPDAFRLSPVSNDLVLKFGQLEVTFREMTHPVRCYAISIWNGSRRFVFSGDTSWNEEIIDFAKGADLLMLDAGLLNQDKQGQPVPHLTAGECGVVAAKAGVGRLLLTHFWPEYDTEELRTQAREHFDRVDVTRLMQTYQV